jgi:hypothetical protein
VAGPLAGRDRILACVSKSEYPSGVSIRKPDESASGIFRVYSSEAEAQELFPVNKEGRMDRFE